MIRAILGSMASGVVQRLVSALITLLLTPVYLRELGNYDYGIWEVIISVVGYLGIVDLGLRPTISRFIATYSGDDPERVGHARRIFTTSLLMMTAAGFLASALLVLWSLLYPEAIAAEGSPEGRYALVLQLTALRLMLTFPGAALESALEGMLRYVEKNAIAVCLAIGGAIYMYFRMDDHDPLILLCIVTLVQTIVRNCAYALLLARDPLRRFAFGLAQWDGQRALEMLRFGSKNLVQGLATLVSQRSDPLVIAWALGPQSVVFFSLAQAMFRQAGSLIAVLTHAMMPGFSRLHADGRSAAIERYFFVGSRAMYAIHGLVASGLFLLSGDFIRLWVGEAYADLVQQVATLLCVRTLVAGALPLHNRLLVAQGRHGPLSVVYVVRAVLALSLSLALVWSMGVVGVALASLGAFAVTLPWIWRLVFAKLPGRSTAFLRTVTLPVLAITLVTTAMGWWVGEMVTIQSWFDLLAQAGALTVIYGSLCALLLLGPDERDLLRRAWRKLAPAALGTQP